MIRLLVPTALENAGSDLLGLGFQDCIDRCPDNKQSLTTEIFICSSIKQISYTRHIRLWGVSPRNFPENISSFHT